MEHRLLEKGYAKDDLYEVWPSYLHTQVGSLLMGVADIEGYFETQNRWVAKKRLLQELPRQAPATSRRAADGQGLPQARTAQADRQTRKPSHLR